MVLKYNTGDIRFALVDWDGVQVSVVPMTVFVKLQENENYELEKAYKCKVKDTFFNPVIKFIGTQEQCNEKESEMVDYNRNESLKKKIHKEPPKKVVTKRTNELKELNKIEILETKLEEASNQISNLRNELQNEQKEHQNEKNEHEETKKRLASLESTNGGFFEPEVREAFLCAAASVWSYLGSPAEINRRVTYRCTESNLKDDNSNQKVTFTPAHPDHFISLQVKKNLQDMKERGCTSKKVFRALVFSKYDSDELLANNCCSTLSSDSFMDACKAYLKENFNDFNHASCDQVLREVTNEARTRLWSKDPYLKFKAGSKVYQLNELQIAQFKVKLEKKSKPVDTNGNIEDEQNENNKRIHQTKDNTLGSKKLLQSNDLNESSSSSSTTEIQQQQTHHQEKQPIQYQQQPQLQQQCSFSQLPFNQHPFTQHQFYQPQYQAVNYYQSLCSPQSVNSDYNFGNSVMHHSSTTYPQQPNTSKSISSYDEEEEKTRSGCPSPASLAQL